MSSKDSQMNSILSVEGHIRAVQHDVRGLVGSGPDGEVMFEDLWEVGPNGKLRMKQPERALEDRTVKNKFTKRGLSYFLRTLLKSMAGTGQSKQPMDITYGWDTNPFSAFVLLGDDGAVPVRQGDSCVLWNESDGQFDNKIAAGSGVAVYGRRGLLLSLTTGIFKRVQIRYPNVSPNYEECEYTFFAQANTVKQDGPTGGDVGIDDFVVKGVALAAAVACGHNEASSQVGTRAVLGVAATHQGLADRLYKHEWYSQGDGSAEGQSGVPASRHVNGSNALSSLYSAGEALDNDGWVSSNADGADISISALTGVSITITAATKRIQVTGAAFTSTHVRKTLKVRNMTTAGNNLDYTIKRVIDGDEVEVFETPAGNETDASADADLVTRIWAQKAFDGRVENEGLVGKGTYDADASATIIQGEKWVSTDGSGPHYVGRIWAASKKVAGVRIVFPKGSIRDFCPNRFKIQSYTSGNPEGGTWTDVVGQDWTGSDQASLIFDNGEYGYEYVFATPITTQGLRLSNMIAVDTLRKVEVGELYIFEVRDGNIGREWLSIGGSNVLRHAVDGVPTYRASTIPAVSNTASAQTIVNALNRRLIGWGIEAYRSTFGFIWIRATVGGSYAQCHVDSTANGSTVNATLGLSTAAVAKTGITQAFTKAQANAVTFIYTLRMAGNFSKPYDF
jgi:hypothetical protein